MKILRNLLLLFALWLFAVTARAQENLRDSLLQRLEANVAQDTTRIGLLNQLAYHFQQVEPNKALEFGLQALDLSQKLSFVAGEATAFNRISGAYWMKAKYAEALEYSFKSLELFQELGDQPGIAQNFNSIANTYNMEGDHEKSLAYYEKSIAIYEKLGDEYHVLRAYANIGRTHFMLKNYEKGLSFLDKVNQAKKNTPPDVLQAIVVNTSADIYQEMGNLQMALVHYQQSLKMVEELKVPRVITYATRGISEVYQKRNDLSLSNRYAYRTWEISRQIDYTENQKNAALILSDNYKKLKRYDSAYHYYVEYAAAKDSMFNTEKEKEIQRLKESFEVSQKEKEIELLKKEQQLQKANVNRQRLYLALSGVSVVFLAILAFTFYRAKVAKHKTNVVLTNQRNRLSEQNQEITAQREMLEIQASELSKSNQVKDRLFSMISHDLRSPFQSLLTITEYLDQQLFSPEDLSRLKIQLQSNIKSLSEMLNNLLYWARTQMKGIEATKEEFDFEALVNKSTKLFSISSQEKDIRLVNQVPEKFMVLADPNQIDVVIRNLVNNGIKFTKPGGEIVIGIASVNKKEATAFVKDNGVGMDADTARKLFEDGGTASTSGTNEEKGFGLGISLCKEFIESNGGKIWLESEPKKGTTFYFTLQRPQRFG